MPFSSTLREALRKQNMGDAIIVLVEIDHPDITEVYGGPILATSDNVPTISNSLEYKPFWFDLQLVVDDPEQPPKAQVTIGNSDQRISVAIMALGTGTPTVNVYIVTGEDPDTRAVSYEGFLLVNMQGTQTQISGDLAMEDLLGAAYPNRKMDPENYSGLFVQ